MRKQTFLAKCHALGVTVQDRGDSIHIDAPQGRVFHSGYHSHSVWFSHGEYTRPEAYACLAEELTGPITKCTTPDCDWCEDTAAAILDK